MDEYIRKADAWSAVEQANGNTTWAERDDCHKRLVNLPSADVVPVVRCKDCKHCYFADNRVPDEQGWVCEINSIEPVNLNGFCSYGERRE